MPGNFHVSLAERNFETVLEVDGLTLECRAQSVEEESLEGLELFSLRVRGWVSRDCAKI